MTRLATFTEAQGGTKALRIGCVLEDGRMLDLSAVPGAPGAGDMLALIEGGPAALTAARALAANPPAAAILPAGSWRLLAPIPRPRRNVFCVGRNYK
jgi:2-keto-4-pentenoate hydratase/2-oxohepta-3-ene-1,7-dioic acid hydratase in catechol pathway